MFCFSCCSRISLCNQNPEKHHKQTHTKITLFAYKFNEFKWNECKFSLERHSFFSHYETKTSLCVFVWYFLPHKSILNNSVWDVKGPCSYFGLSLSWTCTNEWRQKLLLASRNFMLFISFYIYLVWDLIVCFFAWFGIWSPAKEQTILNC